MFPIREISTYQRKWTIKARVTSKAQVRTFNGQRGAGKVFSADLLDAEGGEIRSNYFGAACDKYDAMLEVGKVYTFSNGQVRVANKRYNSLNHAYEVTFNDDAVIAPADDDANIEAIKFSFMTIRAAANKPCPATVDICGVVKNVSPMSQVKTRNGDEIPKRVLTLCDSSMCTMDVTIWNDQAKADEEQFKGHPIICMKGVRIGEWGGRSGSLGGSAKMQFNLDIDRVKELRTWWEEKGQDCEYTILTNAGGGQGGGPSNGKITSISAMKNQCDNLMTESKFFNILCYVSHIRTKDREGKPSPIFYDSCPGCKKKLQENQFCANCYRTVESPAPRFFANSCLIDRSDCFYSSLFDDTASIMLPQPVEYYKKHSLDGSDMQEVLSGENFARRFKVTVRARTETYNDETRLKFQAVRAEKPSYAEISKTLFNQVCETGLIVC